MKFHCPLFVLSLVLLLSSKTTFSQDTTSLFFENLNESLLPHSLTMLNNGNRIISGTTYEQAFIIRLDDDHEISWSIQMESEPYAYWEYFQESHIAFSDSSVLFFSGDGETNSFNLLEIDHDGVVIDSVSIFLDLSITCKDAIMTPDSNIIFSLVGDLNVLLCIDRFKNIQWIKTLDLSDNNVLDNLQMFNDTIFIVASVGDNFIVFNFLNLSGELLSSKAVESQSYLFRDVGILIENDSVYAVYIEDYAMASLVHFTMNDTAYTTQQFYANSDNYNNFSNSHIVYKDSTKIIFYSGQNLVQSNRMEESNLTLWGLGIKDVIQTDSSTLILGKNGLLPAFMAPKDGNEFVLYERDQLNELFGNYGYDEYCMNSEKQGWFPSKNMLFETLAISVSNLNIDSTAHLVFWSPFSVNLKYQCHEAPNSTMENFIPSVTIFPNPARDRLTIQSENKARFIELVSSNGESVLKEIVNETTFSLDLSNINTGLYFVKIYFEHDVHTERVIVLR